MATPNEHEKNGLESCRLHMRVPSRWSSLGKALLFIRN